MSDDKAASFLDGVASDIDRKPTEGKLSFSAWPLRFNKSLGLALGQRYSDRGR